MPPPKRVCKEFTSDPAEIKKIRSQKRKKVGPAPKTSGRRKFSDKFKADVTANMKAGNKGVKDKKPRNYYTADAKEMYEAMGKSPYV
jgi:hypothetical protein